MVVVFGMVVVFCICLVFWIAVVLCIYIVFCICIVFCMCVVFSICVVLGVGPSASSICDCLAISATAAPSLWYYCPSNTLASNMVIVVVVLVLVSVLAFVIKLVAALEVVPVLLCYTCKWYLSLWYYCSYNALASNIQRINTSSCRSKSSICKTILVYHIWYTEQDLTIEYSG